MTDSTHGLREEPGDPILEAQSTTTFDKQHYHLPHPHLPHHHPNHRPYRLLHMIHPSDLNGKFAADYDIVVYGTPEHLSCVNDVREHHLSRHDVLRDKHTDLLQEFDDIHETLGHLSDELNRMTDHAVALHASFNKFGYSAHIRTNDDVESWSIGSGRGVDAASALHRDRSKEPIQFFRKSTVRQYFHKGLLWRSSRSGEVGSFELFTDLIYVGVIDYVGEAAVTGIHFVLHDHYQILSYSQEGPQPTTDQDHPAHHSTCVVVILTCIPLAHRLISLSLIGITTSLFLLVLILDIFGNSCPDDQSFTGGWGSSPDTRCKYTAKLRMGRQRKAKLQKKLTAGEKIKLKDALQRSRSGSIGSETTMNVNEEWHGGHLSAARQTW